MARADEVTDLVALLLDHAGAVHEHGFPSDPREWSLDGRMKRKAAPSVRTCPKCYAAMPGGTLACTECGFIFPVEERDAPSHVDGELMEAEAKPPPTMAERRAWYAGACEQAAKRHRKVGYARHQYREQFGKWPRFQDVEQLYYPEAVAAPAPLLPEPQLTTSAPQESVAIVAVEASQLTTPAPPVRARRIDLAALLRTSAVPAGEFAPVPEPEVAWSL